jgi:hypothetical protein
MKRAVVWTDEMRDFLRTRQQFVRERSSHIRRVQKTLEDANTDIMGVDAMPTQPRLPPQSSASAVALDARVLPLRAPARYQQGADQHSRRPGLLRRAHNVLLIGPPGIGKTATGLGLLREACLNGCRGRFNNAQALLDELYASLADRSTRACSKRLSRPQPLLIDELGHLTLKPEQANDFFKPAAPPGNRHGRRQRGARAGEFPESAFQIGRFAVLRRLTSR